MKKVIGRYIFDSIIRYRIWPPFCLLAFSAFVMIWQISVRVPEEKAFQEHGAQTMGTIINLKKERVGLFSSSTPSARIFKVLTRFQDQRGDTFQFEDEVSRQTFGALAIGNSVLVNYVQYDPEMARLQIREHRVSPGQNFTLWKWIGGGAALWLAANIVRRIMNRRSDSEST